MQGTSSDEIAISEMHEEDLEEILVIEKKSFVSPWSKRLFRETLSFQHSVNLVIRTGDRKIFGYINVYLIGYEAHVLNIAIDPVRRKMGYASKLLRFAIDNLQQRKATEFFLEVRESNMDAIHLYERLGFEMIGRRKKYYTETNEDALVMHLAPGSE